jgi:glutamine amidotransferase
MHNGQIDHFDRIRRPMEAMLDDEHFHARVGTTDSELLFLLALQFGLKERPIAAMEEAVGFVEQISLHLTGAARIRMTAAFSDGDTLYAVRYSTDEYAPTLYAAPMGPRGSYCLVSEPLNDDTDTWVEIPASSAVILSEKGLEATEFKPTVTSPAREQNAAVALAG